MPAFIIPTTRRLTQDWMADFDDWNGDGIVDYPGGFYSTIGWDGHNGLDYGTPNGDPIVASADGIVEYAGWAGSHWLLSGGGNVVLIKHPNQRVRTEYLHLSQVLVVPGQHVTQGQRIGLAGKTGTATGYHLHFGFIPMDMVNVNNRRRGRIDPYPFLRGITVQSTPAPTPKPKQEEEKMLIVAKAPNDDRVWIGDGVTRRHITSPDMLSAIQWLAQRKIGPAIFEDGKVQTIPAGVDAIGADIYGDQASRQQIVAQTPGGSELWIGDGVTRRHIPDLTALEGIRTLARLGALDVYKDGEAQILETLDIIGSAVAK